jgi:hypothetical protein
VFLFFLLTGEIELNFPTCNLLLAHLSWRLKWAFLVVYLTC